MIQVCRLWSIRNSYMVIMVTTSALAGTAALVGDPTRAAMLLALTDGRAFTASELARAAGVSPQTASGHLARLAEAGMLTVGQQGRHRYHRIASREVVRMLEAIMVVAGATPGRAIQTGPRDATMRTARTCYDHLAGKLAVALADALVARGQILLSDDGGAVTADGLAFFASLGIDAHMPEKPGARVFCRPCLDWSERRPHLAGRIGMVLCAHCLDRGWVRRIDGTRALSVTPEGWRGLRSAFGPSVDAARPDALGSPRIGVSHGVQLEQPH